MVYMKYIQASTREGHSPTKRRSRWSTMMPRWCSNELKEDAHNLKWRKRRWRSSHSLGVREDSQNGLRCSKERWKKSTVAREKEWSGALEWEEDMEFGENSWNERKLVGNHMIALPCGIPSMMECHTSSHQRPWSLEREKTIGRLWSTHELWWN